MLECMKKYFLAKLVVYWSIPLIVYAIIELVARLTGKTEIMPVFILLLVFVEFVITMILLIGRMLHIIYGDKR